MSQVLHARGLEERHHDGERDVAVLLVEAALLILLRVIAPGDVVRVAEEFCQVGACGIVREQVEPVDGRTVYRCKTRRCLKDGRENSSPMSNP